MRSFERIPLCINAAVLLILPVCMLAVPLRWLIGWLLAVLTHEICHCIALLLFQIRVLRLYIGILGIQIETEPMRVYEELICALAGPLGGGLLVLCNYFPEAAICACFLNVYNLLPIYPLDGGRVAACIHLTYKHELKFPCKQRKQIVQCTGQTYLSKSERYSNYDQSITKNSSHGTKTSAVYRR